MRYSYATVALPTLTPAQAIEELASAGYQGVEWKVGEPAGRRPGTADYFIYQNRCTLPLTPDGDQRVRQQCRDAGVDIVGLAPYLAIGDIAALRTAISMASAMGAGQVRIQAARWGQHGDQHYAAENGQPLHLRIREPFWLFFLYRHVKKWLCLGRVLRPYFDLNAHRSLTSSKLFPSVQWNAHSPRAPD